MLEGQGDTPGRPTVPATVPQEGPQSQPHRLTQVPSQVEGLQVYVCAQGLHSIRPTYRSEQAGGRVLLHREGPALRTH